MPGNRDLYAGAEFPPGFAEAVALADRIGSRVCGDDEARARRHFSVTSRYESMFW
jgi:thiaminase (transcriptional activator TenA)